MLDGADSVTQGAERIVHFDHPPVVEVVAGVAFEGLGPEASPYLAGYWNQHLRDRFPRVEQQPPYQPPREAFGPERVAQQFQFSFMASMPPSRLWASSVSGSELVQLQPGWFACNWRKTEPDTEYDHWQKRRQVVATEFALFSDFLANQGLSRPKVTQCEVTYVNHIQPNVLWDSHAQIDRIFPFLSPKVFEGSLEQLSSEMQVALSREGVQFGRLHVKILPAFAKDGRTPLYVFELTARGPVNAEGVGAESSTTFLDAGRSAIVKTFLQLTNDEMQVKVWGKR